MHILQIPLPLAFVAETQHHRRDLDERERHVVVRAAHHLRQQVVGAVLVLLATVAALRAVQAEAAVLFRFGG